MFFRRPRSDPCPRVRHERRRRPFCHVAHHQPTTVAERSALFQNWLHAYAAATQLMKRRMLLKRHAATPEVRARCLWQRGRVSARANGRRERTRGPRCCSRRVSVSGERREVQHRDCRAARRVSVYAAEAFLERYQCPRMEVDSRARQERALAQGAGDC